MEYHSTVKINEREISIKSPTYFIADIASNHDGDISRAKELIWLAKEAGADAAKFQHFVAEKIVSDIGFQKLGSRLSHQSSWNKSVFNVFKEYESKREWTEELYNTAKEANIDFMTTPYDFEAIELLDRYIPAYKIGSGDITWIEFIEAIARKNKPTIIATGASDFNDVERAVKAITKYNKQVVLLQCNTNYTGDIENFNYINLNVLRTYSTMFPNMILGLSDHTPGHSTVLGAIALGARVIEKHFTDDNQRVGPDHKFSMNPVEWRTMIERSRELELSLGDGVKRIEVNEQETVMVQRRCIRLKRNVNKGEVISEHDLECLRPAPEGSIEPFNMSRIIGKKLKVTKIPGDALYWADLEDF